MTALSSPSPDHRPPSAAGEARPDRIPHTLGSGARIITGDCRVVLPTLPTESVQCAFTSPPYFRQRDYGVDGQIGQETTPADLAEALCEVGRELRRVLKPDGVFWLQMGDTYAAGGNGGGGSLVAKRRQWTGAHERKGWRRQSPGFKQKDITLTPFVVADLLRADGWYLRGTIIWDKVIATEPPRLDRPSTAHEYLFLLSKSKCYRVRDHGETWFRSTVWSIRPQPTYLGHPAVMPEELARRCLACSTAPGDTVIDPFVGAGTTAVVAERLGLSCIGIELNPTYAALTERRLIAHREGPAAVARLRSEGKAADRAPLLDPPFLEAAE